jgi:hypothetical protein
MILAFFRHLAKRWLLLAAMLLVVVVYWPGMSGGFLFDDYPNIVQNRAVQPSNANFSSLVGAALSSPSSEFKRPLASLSFAVNYLLSGLDPYWMKLTNLIIHLLNGLLIFLLARALVLAVNRRNEGAVKAASAAMLLLAENLKDNVSRSTIVAAEAGPTTASGHAARHSNLVATVVAASWMLLPINLTGVLYVVQRMESMANLFVLLGLVGYVAGRQCMLDTAPDALASATRSLKQLWHPFHGFALCVISILVCTLMGLLAKETAVMLPLYAALIEWLIFGFRKPTGGWDNRLVSMFVLLLLVPMIVGLTWMLPQVLNPADWSTRDFGLRTRLLSEARIVVDYVRWTLLPTPDALSFYHDDFRISQGLLKPWTTLGSMVFLAAMLPLMWCLRKRLPLASLGIALFLGSHLLTGTILPLELIYEHRNYFSSFGLMLALVPLLVPPAKRPFALPRHTLLIGLLLYWTMLTALTSYTWGDTLRLAEDLADRAPQSPRAQYELGRTYIIQSHYDPASPFTKLAYAPLERAAALPESSILPEQALIFMNARMDLPLKDAWWESMLAKLKAHKPGVQDESSLAALTQCKREHHCNFPKDRLTAAFDAALAHPDPGARLLATYGDYAWNVLDNQILGEQLTQHAVNVAPNEPAYMITLIRMLVARGQSANARTVLKQLQRLNIGGRLDSSIAEFHSLH